MEHSVLIIDSDAEFYKRQIHDSGMNVDVVAVPDLAHALPHVAHATALCALAPVLNDELIARATRLQWIQALTTGVDTITSSAELPASVTVTNVRGIHGPQMSELAILQMLALCRNYRGMLANQQRSAWERWPQPVLAGKTAGIFGIGEISYALARRLKAFDMQVIGFTGSPERAIADFDRLEARERLAAVAPELDFLIVLAPRTPQNENFIDRGVLRAMHPGAYLVNLARGGIVNEEALLQALQEGCIAGAALDVFLREPLPQQDPLWHAPNLLITPHIGGMSTNYAQQAWPVLRENLARFLNGERGAQLMNCVLAR